ncbi:MAG: hypothetical protein CVV57_00665 [Tenericutes bacterium HGW-Tenericutes-2]|jgi:uncharacterized lipoprotein NlpE involved in copper resistance|nr:MAG: hypothetical protein CVV57_00665 [Tenericutes bacterium HGW-Tenericutes-2]
MKKILFLLTILLVAFALVGCKNDETEDPDVVDTTFRLLMEAEDLSGMANKTSAVIREAGSLGLPTSYQGVQISYQSRNVNIIDNTGNVTLPTECWIESRDQQGVSKSQFNNLNDNWPVVVDVILTYQGQTRTAKLLFVVAPQEGFTCNKYLG